MKITGDYEWLSSASKNLVAAELTKHAATQLGDVVLVELLNPGTTVSRDQEIVIIESDKAASDILLPINGDIVEFINLLLDSPSMVKDDTLGEDFFQN